MRVALISDLHANLAAVRAVLDDIERTGVDQLFCLGDVVDLGPHPVETVSVLRALGCEAVLGNHDPLDEPAEGPLLDWQRWTAEQLDDGDRAWLDLPGTRRLPLGDSTMLCVHGSPRSFDEQILPATSDEALDEMLDGVEADVVVAGHTHIQLTRVHRGRLVANVGSVGMPFEKPYDGTPPRIKRWAEYAIVHHERGLNRVELRRVDYDFDGMARHALRSGMPHVEFWLRHFV